MEENFPQVDLVDLIDQPAWKTILIDLIKSEKMDPWDIDICLLADKYLTKINQMEHSNLKIPANAILASAILLKMKARALKLRGLEDEEEAAEELSQEDLRMIGDSIPELKGMRQFRKGKFSLDDLVDGIADVLEKTKKKQSSILRTKEIQEFNILVDDEDVEKKVADVERRINELADSQGLVTFSQLLDENTPIALVNTFIPLLFLMNRGVINAWQEQWFGEIMIALLKNDNGAKEN